MKKTKDEDIAMRIVRHQGMDNNAIWGQIISPVFGPINYVFEYFEKDDVWRASWGQGGFMHHGLEYEGRWKRDEVERGLLMEINTLMGMFVDAGIWYEGAFHPVARV